MLLHRYFIQNGEVAESGDYRSPGGIQIYEVVRIVQGIPLFLEDHLKRFYHSAWLCHLEIPLREEEIRFMLEKLIDVNVIHTGNVKFSYCFSPESVFQAFFIPHFYPGGQMVENGVVCGILQAERNDPNAKVLQADLRGKANQLMEEQGYYEVLLRNQDGRFTEGSRSNLFFLRGKVFYTAPDEEILPGITRKKAIVLIKEMDYQLEYKSLTLHETYSMEAAFLTGTSPKILPVRQIGETLFAVGQLPVSRLIAAYNRLEADYILFHKRPPV